MAYRKTKRSIETIARMKAGKAAARMERPSPALWRRSRLTDGLGHMPRHPTLDECGAAGNGGTYSAAVYTEGGLPDTTDERARFEAYMRGHCWDAGKYDDRLHCYDTTTVRMLYGVWRDRGSLPTVWPNVEFSGTPAALSPEAPLERRVGPGAQGET